MPLPLPRLAGAFLARIDGTRSWGEIMAEVVAGGGQVEGRADRGGAGDDAAGGVAAGAEPQQQRVAAQRHAGRETRHARKARSDCTCNGVNVHMG